MKTNSLRFLSLLLCAALLVGMTPGLAVSAAETEEAATVAEQEAPAEPTPSAEPASSEETVSPPPPRGGIDAL